MRLENRNLYSALPSSQHMVDVPVIILVFPLTSLWPKDIEVCLVFKVQVLFLFSSLQFLPIAAIGASIHGE
jgi:hypothetical protein